MQINSPWEQSAGFMLKYIKNDIMIGYNYDFKLNNHSIMIKIPL